jgi:hypothetical protein
MDASIMRRGTWLDRLLIVLAVAYFAVAAIWDFGDWVRASADEVGDGRVWVLFTSSLEVAGSVPLLQVLLGAAVAAAVIVREGPRLWWVVAVVGHVGSGLIAYGIIGLAELLDSRSAERVADNADYGVSCVLAASLGALAMSGALALGRRQGRRARRWDGAALGFGLLGMVGLLPVSFGWYDVEHPISYALGAAFAWLIIRRRSRSAPASGQAQRGPA